MVERREFVGHLHDFQKHETSLFVQFEFSLNVRLMFAQHVNKVAFQLAYATLNERGLLR